MVCPVIISYGQVYVVYLKKKNLYCRPLWGGQIFLRGGQAPLAPPLAPVLHAADNMAYARPHEARTQPREQTVRNVTH